MFVATICTRAAPFTPVRESHQALYPDRRPRVGVLQASQLRKENSSDQEVLVAVPPGWPLDQRRHKSNKCLEHNPPQLPHNRCLISCLSLLQHNQPPCLSRSLSLLQPSTVRRHTRETFRRPRHDRDVQYRLRLRLLLRRPPRGLRSLHTGRCTTLTVRAPVSLVCKRMRLSLLRKKRPTVSVANAWLNI